MDAPKASRSCSANTRDELPRRTTHLSRPLRRLPPKHLLVFGFFCISSSIISNTFPSTTSFAAAFSAVDNTIVAARSRQHQRAVAVVDSCPLFVSKQVASDNSGGGGGGTIASATPATTTTTTTEGVRSGTGSSLRRRALLATAASAVFLLTSSWWKQQPAFAKEAATTSSNTAAPAFDLFSAASSPAVADSINLPMGLLESRVVENLLSPPPYGMERPDVSYPAWFQGTWNVASTTASVEAPCGLAFFGTNATYAAAQKQVGTTLRYESRFVGTTTTTTTANDKAGDSTTTDEHSRSSISGGSIADREYNVKSIAKAALGVNSVVDIPVATPNKLTAILATAATAPPTTGSPPSSGTGDNGGLLQVDLFTVSRRQEAVDATHFDCSEVVREIVSAVKNGSSISRSSSNAPPPMVLKEIETTSLYAFDPVKNVVTCRQRSAAFLLPSQSNPMLLRMWELARGRPVDVRFYDVVYTKK